MIVEKMNKPFWIVRLIALGLTFALAIVDLGLGLNALVQAKQLKSQVAQGMPDAIIPFIIKLFDPNLKLPIDVTTNADDITQTGIIVTVVAVLIALSCIVMFFFHLRGPLSPLALRIQGAILAFCGVWLFAVLVPFTVFFETRSAVVGVTVFSVQVPEDIVQAALNVLGLQSQYSQLGFLQLIAIMPWFTVIFSITTAIILFIAASRVYSNSKWRYRDYDYPLEKVPAVRRKDVVVSPEPDA